MGPQHTTHRIFSKLVRLLLIKGVSILSAFIILTALQSMYKAANIFFSSFLAVCSPKLFHLYLSLSLLNLPPKSLIPFTYPFICLSTQCVLFALGLCSMNNLRRLIFLNVGVLSKLHSSPP